MCGRETIEPTKKVYCKNLFWRSNIVMQILTCRFCKSLHKFFYLFCDLIIHNPFQQFQEQSFIWNKVKLLLGKKTESEEISSDWFKLIVTLLKMLTSNQACESYANLCFVALLLCWSRSSKYQMLQLHLFVPFWAAGAYQLAHHGVFCFSCQRCHALHCVQTPSTQWSPQGSLYCLNEIPFNCFFFCGFDSSFPI